MKQGVSWGYAVTETGNLVIRCWYLLFGAFALGCFSAFMFVSTFGITQNIVISIVSLVLGLYCFWSFYLEVRGVRIIENFVTYPVRLGVDSGIFPLFPKTVDMTNVLHASSLRQAGGLCIGYLSGEFGLAKILFDTKGGRDRFFAILETRFPEIKIYRWT